MSERKRGRLGEEEKFFHSTLSLTVTSFVSFLSGSFCTFSLALLVCHRLSNENECLLHILLFPSLLCFCCWFQLGSSSSSSFSFDVICFPLSTHSLSLPLPSSLLLPSCGNDCRSIFITRPHVSQEAKSV